LIRETKLFYFRFTPRAFHIRIPPCNLIRPSS
jgi:hypothetical protein